MAPGRTGTTEPLALLVSEEAHYCIDRAVKVMGWGEGGIVKVPTDDNFKMQAEQLEVCYQQAQRDGRRVIAVVGSALHHLYRLLRSPRCHR